MTLPHDVIKKITKALSVQSDVFDMDTDVAVLDRMDHFQRDARSGGVGTLLTVFKKVVKAHTGIPFDTQETVIDRLEQESVSVTLFDFLDALPEPETVAPAVEGVSVPEPQKTMEEFFVEEFIETRKRRKMTQNVFSQKIGWLQSKLAKMELGKYTPMMSEIVHICKTLCLDFTGLIGAYEGGNKDVAETEMDDLISSYLDAVGDTALTKHSNVFELLRLSNVDVLVDLIANYNDNDVEEVFEALSVYLKNDLDLTLSIEEFITDIVESID